VRSKFRKKSKNTIECVRQCEGKSKKGKPETRKGETKGETKGEIYREEY
jgi:hypothetical protein